MFSFSINDVHEISIINKFIEKALQLTISPQVISALTDVVFDQIGFLAIDLEYFSKYFIIFTLFFEKQS